MPRLLYLFALCNLVIGTGAFVLSGVLAPLADALQVSVAAAGQAMTVYALATAVLAPLALVLTGALAAAARAVPGAGGVRARQPRLRAGRQPAGAAWPAAC